MKQQGVLDFYFGECPEFVDLLDAIREKYEPQRYLWLSLYICNILEIPIHETGLAQLYLLTGKYDSSLCFPKVTVVTGEDIYAIEYPDRKAVYLSLLPDATKDDVINYVEKNWQEVRQILNNNFPERKRTTTPIKKLNDWLEIADKVYQYKKDKLPNRQIFYENLALNYRIKSTEVQKYAKRYKKLMDLKYPSFELDAGETIR